MWGDRLYFLKKKVKCKPGAVAMLLLVVPEFGRLRQEDCLNSGVYGQSGKHGKILSFFLKYSLTVEGDLDLRSSPHPFTA